jgi:hypothetical protein
MAPAPPSKPRLAGAVTPDAKVSWSADEDSERAGFDILWRETTDQRWQVYEFVTEPKLTVLEGVSTDNHFFAVRSVGKNGARSIAVPTEMEREAPPTPTDKK